MKVVIATLLFISAAEAIRNLVGLPEERSSRLHHLLKDGPIDAKKLLNPYSSKTIANLADLFEKHPLNDNGESASASGESGSGSGESGSGSGETGSGSGEGGSGMEPDTLKALVKSLLKIGPALKQLKEARDKSIEENANELLEALKHKDDDEILILLGRHVIEQHDECDSIKQKFADYVHKSVLYELLKGQDTLNFQRDLVYVLEAAKLYPEVDAFEAFSYVVEWHGLQDHPGIKAIMVIGELVAEAACDEKLDGLFNKVGELIELHDPHGNFDLASRINLDIYMDNSTVCRRGLVKRLEPPQSNIKDRLLDLLFSGHQPDCHEVKIIRFVVDTIVDSIKVAHKFAWLHGIAKGYEHELIKHVTYFMQHGHQDLAYKIVGEYMLANVRGAVTVGLAVEKRFKPKPTGSKPTGSRPITTTAPESTTAPQTTTEASESTTAPQTTTEASESTTAPQTTTEASESTTAPQTTTEASESTTAPQGSRPTGSRPTRSRGKGSRRSGSGPRGRKP